MIEIPVIFAWWSFPVVARGAIRDMTPRGGWHLMPGARKRKRPGTVALAIAMVFLFVASPLWGFVFGFAREHAPWLYAAMFRASVPVADALAPWIPVIDILPESFRANGYGIRAAFARSVAAMNWFFMISLAFFVLLFFAINRSRFDDARHFLRMEGKRKWEWPLVLIVGGPLFGYVLWDFAAGEMMVDVEDPNPDRGGRLAAIHLYDDAAGFIMLFGAGLSMMMTALPFLAATWITVTWAREKRNRRRAKARAANRA